MSEWNLSSDQITLEQPPRRRSPVQWLRDNSIRIAVLVGLAEAVVAWQLGFYRVLWLIALVAVFGYLWLRRRAPRMLRRPLWVFAMSQAVAGITVTVVSGLYFIAAVVGGLLLLIFALVLLGDLRRT